MNKQDLKNIKKMLIEKYEHNSSEIDMLNKKINILNLNSINKKLNSFLTWVSIPCTVNVILLPNLINIDALPLNLLQALNISVPILIGIAGEKLTFKKANEEMKKISNSKTYKQRIEELTRYEIEKDKLELLNDDLNVQKFLIEEKLLNDCIVTEKNINEVEVKNNIQNIKENIEKKQKEINETLTKEILTSNFNKFRNAKSDAFISSMFGGLGLYAICNIHLISRVYNGKINNALEVAAPFIIGALSFATYSIKEIKDNLDVFNKLNDELGDSKLPEYSKEQKKYTEDYHYYLRLKMAELRELRIRLEQEFCKLTTLDNSQNSQIEKYEQNVESLSYTEEQNVINEEKTPSLIRKL